MGSEFLNSFLLRKPVLVHTVQRFLELDAEMPIAVVLPADHVVFWEQPHRGTSQEQLSRVHLTKGGSTRTESVLAGLTLMEQLAVPSTETLVAIHDGVRPFPTQELLNRAYEVAQREGASAMRTRKIFLYSKGQRGRVNPSTAVNFLKTDTSDLPTRCNPRLLPKSFE